MGLDHHGAVVGVLRVGLEALRLLDSQRCPVNAVGAVDFLGDQLDALTQRHLQIVQELDVDRLLAGLDNGLSQLDRTLAAVTPVVGLGAADTVLLAELLEQSDLGVGIGVEAVDADDRVDAGLLDGVDMVEQVAGALFQKLEVLLGVLLGQRCARGDLRAAAVHLERADGRDQNGDVRGQAGKTGLDVPELFKADVGSEAGLGDMIVEQLEGQTVSDNRGLADGDVGERAGMNQNRLMLDGVAHGGVDGVAHPRGHGASDLEILAGDRLAAAGVGDDDLADTLTQILQVARDGENGHQLGADGDAELGLHQVAVQTAAEADDDVAKALCAEVHDPAHLDTLGVDVETLEALLCQPFVIVIALVLHTSGQSDHGKVVGVHDVVDIAGEAQREFGHWHQQGVAAACRGALDVHGRAAGGLTQCAADILAELAEAFDQAKGNGGLALAEGGRGDRGDLDELAVGLILQTLHDLDEVDLRGLAVGNDLLGQQAELLAEIIHGGKCLFCFLSDLPVLVHGRVECDVSVLVHILAVNEIDCHGVFLLKRSAGVLTPPVENNGFGAALPKSTYLSALIDKFLSVGFRIPLTFSEVNEKKTFRDYARISFVGFVFYDEHPTAS